MGARGVGTSSSDFSASDTEGGTARRPREDRVWPDGIGCVLYVPLTANEQLIGPQEWPLSPQRKRNNADLQCFGRNPSYFTNFVQIMLLHFIIVLRLILRVVVYM